MARAKKRSGRISVLATPEFAVSATEMFGWQKLKFVPNAFSYGNLVTDMRLKDIVPPSSEPRQ